jgi:hypothetical protein
MDGDLRSRVVSLEHNTQTNGQRLTALEAWKTQIDIGEAKRGEQFKSMDQRFERIERDLTQISGTLAKIMWLVVGGIIMAMVAFLVKGGFAP